MSYFIHRDKIVGPGGQGGCDRDITDECSLTLKPGYEVNKFSVFELSDGVYAIALDIVGSYKQVEGNFTAIEEFLVKGVSIKDKLLLQGITDFESVYKEILLYKDVVKVRGDL